MNKYQHPANLELAIRHRHSLRFGENTNEKCECCNQSIKESYMWNISINKLGYAGVYLFAIKMFMTVVALQFFVDGIYENYKLITDNICDSELEDHDLYCDNYLYRFFIYNRSFKQDGALSMCFGILAYLCCYGFLIYMFKYIDKNHQEPITIRNFTIEINDPTVNVGDLINDSSVIQLTHRYHLKPLKDLLQQQKEVQKSITKALLNQQPEMEGLNTNHQNIQEQILNIKQNPSKYLRYMKTYVTLRDKQDAIVKDYPDQIDWFRNKKPRKVNAAIIFILLLIIEFGLNFMALRIQIKYGFKIKNEYVKQIILPIDFQIYYYVLKVILDQLLAKLTKQKNLQVIVQKLFVPMFAIPLSLASVDKQDQVQVIQILVLVIFMQYILHIICALISWEFIYIAIKRQLTLRNLQVHNQHEVNKLWEGEHINYRERFDRLILRHLALYCIFSQLNFLIAPLTLLYLAILYWVEKYIIINRASIKSKEKMMIPPGQETFRSQKEFTLTSIGQSLIIAQLFPMIQYGVYREHFLPKYLIFLLLSLFTQIGIQIWRRKKQSKVVTDSNINETLLDQDFDSQPTYKSQNPLEQ